MPNLTPPTLPDADARALADELIDTCSPTTATTTNLIAAHLQVVYQKGVRDGIDRMASLLITKGKTK